jgi:DNA-binding transcriptional LysR family regulator
MESAEADIASARLAPRGHLRVHALPFIAVRHLAPVLPDFLTRYPQITLDFMITNRLVDVLGENLDVSLRMGQLNDSALVARKIIDLPRIVCASPEYIARRGRPVQPADLVHHSCLILSRNPGSAVWPFEVGGKLLQVEVKGSVSADSTAMLLGLAIEGAGILRLSEHVVGEAIQKGQLIPLLQDVRDPEKYPLWALLPPGRNQASKVRAFLDFLLERLGSAPWRPSAEATGVCKYNRQPIQN